MDDSSSSGSIFVVDKKKARFYIIPASYEKTTSFQKGTAYGPIRVLQVFSEQEFYDEEVGFIPAEYGIYACPICYTFDDIRKSYEELDKGIFPILIGGEHTVSYVPISYFYNIYKKLVVVQIDAHADLRDIYDGNRLSHATVMRRVMELGENLFLYQFGVRAISLEERRYIESSSKVYTFFDRELVGNWWEEALRYIKKDIYVYITIDVDGFSTSVFPGTGTPEPGGIAWYEGLTFLRRIIEEYDVVGIDVVEVMPQRGAVLTEYNAARLIYKLIGYIAKKYYRE
jgi:agmatinase